LNNEQKESLHPIEEVVSEGCSAAEDWRLLDFLKLVQKAVAD
jgi:hypothetical protein